MNQPPRTITLLSFLAIAMFVIVGLGFSLIALKNASPLLCAIIGGTMLAWLVCLSVTIACLGVSKKWKAFSLTALLVTSLHLWLANNAIRSGFEPTVFPATAILDAVWRVIRVSEPADAPNLFVGSIPSEFAPVWEYFVEIGVMLCSFWLGFLAGIVTLVLSGGFAASRPDKQEI